MSTVFAAEPLVKGSRVEVCQQDEASGPQQWYEAVVTQVGKNEREGKLRVQHAPPGAEPADDAKKVPLHPLTDPFPCCCRSRGHSLGGRLGLLRSDPATGLPPTVRVVVQGISLVPSSRSVTEATDMTQYSG